MTTPVSLLILVLIAGYAALIIRKQPFIGLMALRNLRVHLGSSLLTVLALMISTSLITMTLTLYATADRSAERHAETHYGNVASHLAAQEQPRLLFPYWTDADIGLLTAAVRQKSRTANVLPVAAHHATVFRTDPEGNPLTVRMKNVYILGFDMQAARSFDPESIKRIPGRLEEGEMILSPLAAKRLEVKEGDRVAATDANGSLQRLTIRVVLPEKGLTGYRGIASDFDQTAATAVVSLRTARLLAGLEPAAYTDILLSESLEFTEGWTARPVLNQMLTDARIQSSGLAVFFGVIGTIAAVIGVILVYQLFALLAEDRRNELGILQAIGFSRKKMIRVLMVEGLFLAVISAAAGVGFGLLSAALFLHWAGETLNRTFHISYSFTVVPSASFASFVAGVLLITACAYHVSVRTIRLPFIYSRKVVRENMRPYRHRTFRSLAALLFLQLGLGAAILLLAVEGIRDNIFRAFQGSPPLFFAELLLLSVLSVIVFVFIYARSMPLLFSVLQSAVRSHGYMTAVFRYASRYLMSFRSRTARFILMFALVFMLIGTSIVISANVRLFLDTRVSAKTPLGGFDLVATAGGIWKTEDLENILDRSDHIERSQFEAMASVPFVRWSTPDDLYVQRIVTFNGIDEHFAAVAEIPFESFEQSFAAERDVWREASKNPDVVIVSRYMLEQRGNRFNIGDSFPIHIGDQTLYKRIIGITKEQDTPYSPVTYGIWFKQSELIVYAKKEERSGSYLLFKTRTDKHLESTETNLEIELLRQNIHPLLRPAIKDQGYHDFIVDLFRLFQLFSWFASVIGTVGLMVVHFRAIRERHRQIATLRAIGIPRKMTVHSFLLEGLFICISGTVIGLVFGSYIGFMVWKALSVYFPDPVQRHIPWMELILTFAAAGSVTCFCLVIPATKTRGIPPSEATRCMTE